MTTKLTNVFSGLISNVKISDQDVVHDFDWKRPADKIPGRQASPIVTVEMDTWHRNKATSWIGRTFVCPVGARDHDRLQRLICTAYCIEDFLTGWTNMLDTVSIWAEVLTRDPNRK